MRGTLGGWNEGGDCRGAVASQFGAKGAGATEDYSRRKRLNAETNNECRGEMLSTDMSLQAIPCVYRLY